MTERQHGISSAIVAMLGVCALMGLKVMGVKEFRAKVNWDILIYIGCMYEIGSALTTWGITKWIGGVLGPVLNPFLSNPVLFVLVFVLLVYLTRFYRYLLVRRYDCIFRTSCSFGSSGGYASIYPMLYRICICKCIFL